MRRGYYPYAPTIPFVQGYDVVGVVYAVGAGVTDLAVGDKVCGLTVHGGYAEVIYRDAVDFVRVPSGLDDAEVVALILNYMTAYQMIHRVAKQTSGQTALVTGANGSVGQAILELLAVTGVHAFGAASAGNHELVSSLGGTPIESRERPIDLGLRDVNPDGVDAAYDALGGSFISQCLRSVKRGGIVVSYGFSSAATGPNSGGSNLRLFGGFFDLFVRAPLMGRRAKFYGITALYRKDRTPFREDLPVLFDQLAQRQITPTIAARLPLLDARHANELLEAGGVGGKIVLVRDPAA